MEIKNIADYLMAVNAKSKKINEQCKKKFNLNINNFWFRGHADAEWDLIPGIYRNIMKFLLENTNNFKHFDGDIIKSKTFLHTIEGNIRHEFKKNIFDLIDYKKIYENDWNLYYLMQHYGLKTRLLDWTTNSLIALFFAVSDFKNNNAKVFILSPAYLNIFTFGKYEFNCTNSIIYPSFHFIKNKKIKWLIKNNEDWLFKLGKNIKYKNNNLHKLLKILGAKYLNFYFSDNEVSYPIAIDALYFDTRLANQNSSFTIFGNKISPFEINNDNLFIEEITINKDYKKDILNELNKSGINNKFIFSNIDGLCKDLNDKYAEQIDKAINKSIIKYVKNLKI